MIFDQRIPASMASLPGRVHRLSTIEDERDDGMQKCNKCLLDKTVDQFRTIRASKAKGGAYLMKICRTCERQARRKA